MTSSKPTLMSEHITPLSVPVLFSTSNGIHIRQVNSPSSESLKFNVEFCDVQRWNRNLEKLASSKSRSSSIRHN